MLARQGGAREVHQTGEGHVPSMGNWGVMQEQANALMIVQPAMLYGMETVPVTSSQVKKLEVTEISMGMRPHTTRPCEKR